MPITWITGAGADNSVWVSVMRLLSASLFLVKPGPTHKVNGYYKIKTKRGVTIFSLITGIRIQNRKEIYNDLDICIQSIVILYKLKLSCEQARKSLSKLHLRVNPPDCIMQRQRRSDITKAIVGTSTICA